MRRVTVRLPEDVVAAFDAADGNRSALMRRRLQEAVEDGELNNVPEDLRRLAAREQAVDRGRYDRKVATFKERCHGFFREKWESGAVDAEDAALLAESWRAEASLYGPDALAFVEAVVDYWEAEWSAATHARPAFPEPGHFMAGAEDAEPDLRGELVEAVEAARADGCGRTEAVERVADDHGAHPELWRAAAEVYGADADGGDASA